MKRNTIVNKPFDKNSIASLLFLEETNSKYLKEKKITNQLIEMYVKLIEYYDRVQDPIKIYFIEKMQRVVINFNKSPNFKTKEEIYNKQSNKEKFNDRYVDMFATQIQQGKDIYEIRKLKLENEMKLDQFIEKGNERKSYLEEIKKFEENNETNTSIIKDNLIQQRRNFDDKLKERRERSLSKNLQNSFGKNSIVFNNYSKQKSFSLVKTFNQNNNILKNDQSNNISKLIIENNLLSQIRNP
jgi:hypothetical protein